MRQGIIRTASDLFERLGFLGSGMQEVASKAGISTKTLYKHFPSKSDLIVEYIRTVLEADRNYNDLLLKNARDPLEYQIGILYYNISRGYPQKYIYMNQLRGYFPEAFGQVEDFKYKYLIQAVHHCLHWGIRENFYRSDIHVGILGKLWIEMAMIAIDLDTFHPDNYNKEQVFIELYKNYLHGIVTPAGEAVLKTHWQHFFEVPGDSRFSVLPVSGA